MIKKPMILFFVSSLLMFYYGCDEEHLSTPVKEVVLRLEPKEGNPRNSEGDFIKLNDGRILFVYTHFTDGSGDNAGAYLAGRISTDDGLSWTDNDFIVNPNEGGMNVMSVSLIRLNNSQIAMFYLRKNSETDCIPLIRISSDEAVTWSDPKECVDEPGYYVMNNDRVVKLKSGRIILPLSLHNTPNSDGWFNGRLLCYYSDDEGNSWRKGNEVSNPENVTSQEPGVIELNGGRLMLFCRTDKGLQYITYSKDKGETWSELLPGNIKSPLSPASIERIPSTGDLLLVWNNNDNSGILGGKRTPFNIAVSQDEGLSWERSKTLESNPDGWYCYTAIEFVDDYILLAHCAGDRNKSIGLETTQITRLNLEWTYKNAVTDPYVKSDRNGIVELGSDEKNPIIYYSIDGSLPNSNEGKLYEEPILVDRTRLLLAQTINSDSIYSKIITAYVGEGVFQNPSTIEPSIQAGLNYSYYEGDLNSTSGIDEISNIESGIISNFSISNSRSVTNFAYNFEGYINIPQNGKYTFFLTSNDGSVLFLNGHELINNDGRHGAYEKSASTSLFAGTHMIQLKYFQTGGDKLLSLMWEGPEFSKTGIPESVLFH